MPFLLRNVTLALGEGEELLAERLLARFSLARDELKSLCVVRKGIDARKKPQIRFVYTLEFSLADEEGFQRRHLADPDVASVPPAPVDSFPRLTSAGRIVIVGTGPAGLFAALRLSEYGLSPVVLERGKPVEERVRDVERFWAEGILDGGSNVQFGEGGAGTFSDGKLTTRVRDDNLRYVLRKLVEFGAPQDILFLAKPHIGTDRLRRVVTALRRHLESRGIDFLFGHQLTDIVSHAGQLCGIVANEAREFPCNCLILAPGHSARDTYGMLARRNVHLEQKPFAVGVRVEHPQELVNRVQYGLKAHEQLPPADYALAHNNRSTGRSAYSFCMCPGGVVIAASSETGGVVTNGMSAYRRSSPYANSALVVNVGHGDFPPHEPLAGVEFQRDLERKAFSAGGGNYRAPAQNLLAFLDGRGHHPLSSTYRPAVTEADLSLFLPSFVTQTLREGLRFFDRKMGGFVTAEATLVGVETRTSAPVRIVRGDNLQSVSLPGLYPTGEGAGYAGGIMSAALDGIRVADAVAARLGREDERMQDEV
jgi:uncharacterized FAD-dependent dehydrogenase